MDKKVLSIYKIPILAAAALSMTILGLQVIRNWFLIVQVVLGSFLGILAVDLEYIIYAYFLEPEKDFSKTVKGFIKHSDFSNLLKFIDYHKNDLVDKSINSALFQGIFALFAIFAMTSSNSYFVKSLVLSIYVNLMYKLIDAYYANKTDAWFWILKNKPDSKGVLIYIFALCVAFVYCLRNF